MLRRYRQDLLQASPKKCAAQRSLTTKLSLPHLHTKLPALFERLSVLPMFTRTRDLLHASTPQKEDRIIQLADRKRSNPRLKAAIPIPKHASL